MRTQVSSSWHPCLVDVDDWLIFICAKSIIDITFHIIMHICIPTRVCLYLDRPLSPAHPGPSCYRRLAHLYKQQLNEWICIFGLSINDLNCSISSYAIIIENIRVCLYSDRRRFTRDSVAIDDWLICKGICIFWNTFAYSNFQFA